MAVADPRLGKTVQVISFVRSWRYVSTRVLTPTAICDNAEDWNRKRSAPSKGHDSQFGQTHRASDMANGAHRVSNLSCRQCKLSQWSSS